MKKRPSYWPISLCTATMTARHMSQAVCLLSFCPEQKSRPSFYAVTTSACSKRKRECLLWLKNIPSRSCDGLTLAMGRRAVCWLWCEIQGRGEARHSSVPSTWIQPGSCCLGHAIEWRRGHIMERLHRFSFLPQTVQQLNKESCQLAVEKKLVSHAKQTGRARILPIWKAAHLLILWHLRKAREYSDTYM